MPTRTTTVADPNNHPGRYSAFWFRFFEILPGACVWAAFAIPFIVSRYYPLWITIFILVFDVYWLVQTFNQTVTLMRGYRRMHQNLAVDWMKKLEHFDAIGEEQRRKDRIMDWHEVYHAVILATYKEELSILEASIDSILKSPFPHKQFIFVLATEERDAANARANGEYLQKKYARYFHRFIVTEHPDGIVGEVKAKGANVTWAAKRLVKEVEEEGLDLEQIIVSTADADTRFSKPFFPCLTYAYVAAPNRQRLSFQPVATYFNNMWESPVTSRIMAFGTTFWQLVESVRNYRLITFSTHAMSLQTLKDMDYWCTSIVNEDSRQFFRAFFTFNGDFEVIPLFIPIFMDAVYTGSFWQSIKSLYYQQQRWAYGVEHFPYIVLESLHHHEIPFRTRLALVYRAFQGAFSWATSSFFISIIGWIPIIFNPSFRDQVIVSNFSSTATAILSLTWLSVIVGAVITTNLVRNLAERKRPLDLASSIVMWILVPFIGIPLGALPGIDSVTRLMLGKYLGFRITEKTRLKPT